MAANAEVAIIGGGVIGFSAAYHLAKQGIPSQVIEMDGIAAKASGRAMGYVGAAGLLTFTTLSNWRSHPDDLDAYPMGDLRPCLELGWESQRLMPLLAEELKEVGGVDPEYGEIAVAFAAFD
jgi:glycine/D-amino acid oxidase-like deaminating enzyme